MGGMAIAGAGLGLMGAASSISGGRAEKKAYEMEAKQAEMQAEVDSIQRKRELNDALAMQAVMFAQQGRVAGVGSAKAIGDEDIRRAGQDIEMIKSGAKVTAASKRLSGRHAERAGITAGIIGSGKSLIKSYQSGGKEFLAKDTWNAGINPKTGKKWKGGE